MIELIKVPCQVCGETFAATKYKKNTAMARFCTTCRYQRSTMKRPYLARTERKKKAST